MATATGDAPLCRGTPSNIAASQLVRAREEVKIRPVVSVRLETCEHHPIIFLNAPAHPSWSLSIIHAFKKKRCFPKASALSDNRAKRLHLDLDDPLLSRHILIHGKQHYHVQV